MKFQLIILSLFISTQLFSRGTADRRTSTSDNVLYSSGFLINNDSRYGKNSSSKDYKTIEQEPNNGKKTKKNKKSDSSIHVHLTDTDSN